MYIAKLQNPPWASTGPAFVNHSTYNGNVSQPVMPNVIIPSPNLQPANPASGNLWMENTTPTGQVSTLFQVGLQRPCHILIACRCCCYLKQMFCFQMIYMQLKHVVTDLHRAQGSDIVITTSAVLTFTERSLVDMI